MFCACNTEMMETYELINISSTEQQKQRIDLIICRRYPSYPIQILRKMRETRKNSEITTTTTKKLNTPIHININQANTRSTTKKRDIGKEKCIIQS